MPGRTSFSWPEPLRRYLTATHGDLRDVVTLGGMSGARVWKAHCRDDTLVIKCSPDGNERVFYESVAPRLERRGISTPKLYWSMKVGSLNWFAIEFIPRPLGEATGEPVHSQVMDTLCRLHSIATGEIAALPGGFQSSWTSEMSNSALSAFPNSIATSIRPKFARFERECQSLFEPECWISGDPNHANWGMREDGTPILYDWERFSLGTPALDLAILIAGLGDSETYSKVAHDYRETLSRMNGSAPYSERALARAIAIAKVWVVVEFLANSVRNSSESRVSEVQDWLVESVPGWLSKVEPRLEDS